MNAQLNGTALLPLESINAVEIFTGAKLDDLLAQIRTEAASLVPDVTTDKGRKEIASVAYKVARSKTAIDDAGKELVSGWKQQAAVVDASRKKARDYLDALRDEVRAPLDAWEAEEARKEQEAIEAARLQREAEEAAARADLERREAAVREAEERIAAAAKAEADRLAAESAERERVEREESIRKEAAEQAKRDAEAAIAKAEQDRIDAERRQAEAAEQARLDAIAAADKAERDQAEAVRQAEARATQQAEQAERDRLAVIEAKCIEDERRAANRAHVGAINRKASAALVAGGLSEADAKAVIILIATGKVPAVSITY